MSILVIYDSIGFLQLLREAPLIGRIRYTRMAQFTEYALTLRMEGME